ncbi:MAG: serine/threonine protein phosphatase [Actinomycetia bacterium]|nr:serine/threonine protein phosphatase [Actinomycetes bacterium]
MIQMPRDAGSVAMWDYEDTTLAVAAVWTEKKPGRGEDAPPTWLFHRSSGRGVIAVYDGLGGSGGRAVGRTPDEVDVSGAFVGSRVARFALEDWFVATAPKRRVSDAGDLHGALLEALRQTGLAPGKLSGTMVRHLPTTLAAIEFEMAEDRVEFAARWAGDSRAYILHTKMGLQPISRDDTPDSDALILLGNDQPMTNLVCADRPFIVNEFLKASPRHLPVLLVCATDGFYNYVPTPAHFEFLLLNTMYEAASLADWTRILADRVQEYTSDDASLVIAVPGYRSYIAMRARYLDRLRTLSRDYIQPFRQVHEFGDGPAIAATKADQWARYRKGYEKWIRQMEPNR